MADAEAPRRTGLALVVWLVVRAVRFLILLVIGMVTVLPFTVVLGNTIRPRMPTRRTPESIGLKWEDVTFQTSDGLTLSAWWIPAPKPSDRTMIVCHGVGANRDDILRFIPFLNEGGYNVLSWDWRGHGNSDWARVTFGLNEKKDARAAVDWVRAKHAAECKWLGALGISMGAGILIQAGPLCPEIQAFVLDSPFASIRTMLPFMLRTLPGWLRDLVCALTAVAGHVCVGASVDEIAPIAVIGKLAPRPVFLAAGKDDRVIPWQETERLGQVAGDPKEVWLEPGIGHTELREYEPDQYHRRVLAFLERARGAASAR